MKAVQTSARRRQTFSSRRKKMKILPKVPHASPRTIGFRSLCSGPLELRKIRIKIKGERPLISVGSWSQMSTRQRRVPQTSSAKFRLTLTKQFRPSQQLRKNRLRESVCSINNRYRSLRGTVRTRKHCPPRRIQATMMHSAPRSCH